mgnify:CR=1 FL=1
MLALLLVAAEGLLDRMALAVLVVQAAQPVLAVAVAAAMAAEVPGLPEGRMAAKVVTTAVLQVEGLAELARALLLPDQLVAVAAAEMMAAHFMMVQTVGLESNGQRTAQVVAVALARMVEYRQVVLVRSTAAEAAVNLMLAVLEAQVPKG